MARKELTFEEAKDLLEKGSIRVRRITHELDTPLRMSSNFDTFEDVINTIFYLDEPEKEKTLSDKCQETQPLSCYHPHSYYEEDVKEFIEKVIHYINELHSDNQIKMKIRELAGERLVK